MKLHSKLQICTLNYVLLPLSTDDTKNDQEKSPLPDNPDDSMEDSPATGAPDSADEDEESPTSQ